MLSSHTEGSLFYNSSAMVQLKFSLILLGELVLAHAAERADPILGQLIEGNITVVNITGFYPPETEFTTHLSNIFADRALLAGGAAQSAGAALRRTPARRTFPSCR